MAASDDSGNPGEPPPNWCKNLWPHRFKKDFDPESDSAYRAGADGRGFAKGYEVVE